MILMIGVGMLLTTTASAREVGAEPAEALDCGCHYVGELLGVNYFNQNMGSPSYILTWFVGSGLDDAGQAQDCLVRYEVRGVDYVSTWLEGGGYDFTWGYTLLDYGWQAGGRDCPLVVEGGSEPIFPDDATCKVAADGLEATVVDSDKLVGGTFAVPAPSRLLPAKPEVKEKK
jgi:hypothetical protein